MPALSGQDGQSLDAALDFVLKLLECLQRVPADKNTIKPSDADAIRRMVEELKRMAAHGRIDWQRADDAIAAETDGNGIHLNPSFGGDYRNDYQLPGDYHLDDCREGVFRL